GTTRMRPAEPRGSLQPVGCCRLRSSDKEQEMHRTTENSLDLKDTSVGVMETTHYRKGKQRCQPTHVREKLVETDSPYRSERPWSYTVTVNGLSLRKDGTVGAMPISMTFSAPDWRRDASG